MLKYRHIIESWVCILKKFVKIFLLSLNAFVSFGMCSMTKVGHVIKPCHAGNFCRQSFPVSSYWFAFITIYYICSLFHTVSGQLPPRKIASQIIAPWMIVPRIIASRTIVHEVNCPQGILPFGQLPPRKISPGKIAHLPWNFLKNNCPHSSKFPSTRTMSELRKTRHCLPYRTIISEYCNLWAKIDLLPYIFYRF